MKNINNSVRHKLYQRVSLGHFPTPLEFLPNISSKVGPKVYVKRDDCTGLAIGGNKVRKLEYLIADAVKGGADTIITAGASQSNHARQTAAAAAKSGLKCILVLEERHSPYGQDYYRNGNVVLGSILGAEIRYVPAETDIRKVMLSVAEEVTLRGGRPYIVPVGGSNVIGTLGYVNFVVELVEQLSAQGTHIDHIVLPSGSAGTHAGVLAARCLLGLDFKVTGISVRNPKSVQEQNVRTLATNVLSFLGAQESLESTAVVVHADYVGEGYGIPTKASDDALLLLAQSEGVLLDPVYTGKAMAGMLDLIRTGAIQSSENVLFLHTGGSPALFGYREHFLK